VKASGHSSKRKRQPPEADKIGAKPKASIATQIRGEGTAAPAAGKGGGAEDKARDDGDLLEGWSAAETGRPIKRSLTIAGHRTAVSLEEPFWEGLRRAASDRDVPIARLVAAIDATRGKTSLSSAIRVFVLDYHRERGA
jgi:predicted DNA-binding ribbon-helix-helix protein